MSYQTLSEKIEQLIDKAIFLNATQRMSFNNLNLLGKENVYVYAPNLISLDSIISASSSIPKNTTVKHLTIKTDSAITKRMYECIVPLNGDNTLERITFDYPNFTGNQIDYICRQCDKLKVIDGTPFDYTTVTRDTSLFFNMCPLLEEIRFAANSIKVNFGIYSHAPLSDATIQSVIDGLADLTGQTSKTVTFHSSIVDRLTTEQFDQITNKNWSVG